MSLDIIDDNLQLSQLNLDDLRIAINWLQRIQSLVCALDPDEQLVESMLELTQLEQGVLQLLLPDDDGTVKLVPSSVDIRERFLDGSSLVRRGVFR